MVAASSRATRGGWFALREQLGLVCGLWAGEVWGPEGSVAADRAALVALYHATDGPNWTDNTGWLSDVPLEAWVGVQDERAGPRVFCATTT